MPAALTSIRTSFAPGLGFSTSTTLRQLRPSKPLSSIAFIFLLDLGNPLQVGLVEEFEYSRPKYPREFIQQINPQEYLRLRTVFNIEGHANSGTGYEKSCSAVVLGHGTLRDRTVPHRPANHRSGT